MAEFSTFEKTGLFPSIKSDAFRIRIKNRSVSGRIASVDIFPRSIKRLSTIE